MDNRPLNVMTVDVEDWFQGIEIDSASWHNYEKRLEKSVRLLLDIFHNADTRATFFVLAENAQRYPQLMREICRQGHDIGTHGLSHQFVYNMTITTFRKELRSSIDVIEQITSQKVLSHRAAFFSITSESLWAFEILSEEGLLYDSSVFPVVNYRYGISNAHRSPFFLRLRNKDILEFPISTYRHLGVNIPFSGGFYLRLIPYKIVNALIRSLNGQDIPVIVYLHPWEVDPHQPRIDLPWRISLPHYCNLRNTRQKLTRLLTDFRFHSMTHVAKTLHRHDNIKAYRIDNGGFAPARKQEPEQTSYKTPGNNTERSWDFIKWTS